MKPILLDLLVPIIIPRLILRLPQIGNGVIVNEAITDTDHSSIWHVINGVKNLNKFKDIAYQILQE